MFSIKVHGDLRRTTSFLERIRYRKVSTILEMYAQEGVEALRGATPVDSGKTANSWSYEISMNGESYTIRWLNDNNVDGVNIAIILQYGHGTRNGGFVEGLDYINPAIKPIFDKISEQAWKEVTSA